MGEPALSDIANAVQTSALESIGITTVAQVADATSEQLAKAKGIGEKSAGKLIEKARAAAEGRVGAQKPPDPRPDAPARPKPKPRPIADLATGALVMVRLVGTQKPYPAVIVDVLDDISGAVDLVAFCHPRPLPGGIRMPVQFARATFEPSDDELRAGSWRWPARL